MKVTVEQDKCASSGNCAIRALEIFTQRDEDGVILLLNENPQAENAQAARMAAAACPAVAISIEE